MVRAIARRYLRAKLDGNAAGQLGAPVARPDLLHRAVQFLGIAPKAAAGGRGRDEARGRSLGDRVYRALYDYLLFEWQVQLIPEYANIPLEAIAEIGPYLYSACDASAVRSLLISKKRGLPLAPAAAAAAHPGPADRRGW